MKNELRMLCGIKEICRYVGMSRPTVMKWIENDGLPVAKINGKWTICVDDVNAWVMEKMQGGH
ncbi:MAG: helix-turn-helix domain-containing protein [Deltaproteobacteria bacterium]|nr:helix-turn-helix domain-containing protein [Deltaproteobacteria bacterium]